MSCSNLVFELWERPQKAGAAPHYIVRVLYNREVLHFPGTDEGATLQFAAPAVLIMQICGAAQQQIKVYGRSLFFSLQMAPSSCQHCLGAMHWTQHSIRTCASSSWSTTAPCQVQKAAMQYRACDTARLSP
jgi:hypothetical protein